MISSYVKQGGIEIEEDADSGNQTNTSIYHFATEPSPDGHRLRLTAVSHMNALRDPLSAIGDLLVLSIDRAQAAGREWTPEERRGLLFHGHRTIAGP